LGVPRMTEEEFVAALGGSNLYDRTLPA